LFALFFVIKFIMPQADLVTFHSLTIWTNILILITFNLSYFFAVPLISVLFKISIKNTFTFIYLFKNIKKSIVKLLNLNNSLKCNRFNNIVLSF
jgi:hypothetical protein